MTEADASKMSTKEEEKQRIWIRQHIKRRECCRPVCFNSRDKPTDENAICVCEIKIKDHIPSDESRAYKGKQWSKVKNTQLLPTNAYGKFTKGKQKGVEYIRVDETTSSQTMKRLFTEVWKLEEPTWIMSIMGMPCRKVDVAKGNLFETQLEAALKRLSSRKVVWLFTDCLGKGPGKAVGKVVDKLKKHHHRKCPLITMQLYPWSAIEKKTMLIADEHKAEKPTNFHDQETSVRLNDFADYAILVDSGPRLQECAESYISFWVNLQSALADKKEDHSIFVESGATFDKYVESSFLAKLESFLADKNKNSRSVPAVMMLFGDSASAKGIHMAMQSDIPVIVIKGSGGMADALATGCLESLAESKYDADGKANEIVARAVIVDDALFKRVKDKGDHEDHDVKLILQCLQKRHLLTVLDLKDPSEDLFRTIIQALLKSSKHEELLEWMDVFFPYSLMEDRFHRGKFCLDAGAGTSTTDLIFMEALLVEPARIDIAELLLGHNFVCLADIFNEMAILYLYIKSMSKLPQELQEILQTNVCRDIPELFNKQMRESLYNVRKDDYDEIASLGSVDEETLDKTLCTFTDTKYDYAIQHWYICKTCNLTGGSGVCEVCVKVCHKNHDTAYSRRSAFFCDCGEKGEGHCKCLIKRGVSVTNDVTDGIQCEVNGEENTDEEEESVDQKIKENTPECIELLKKIREYIKGHIPKQCYIKDKVSEYTKLEVEKELLLWATITNRRGVARLFWKKSKDLVVSAMYSCTLLDRLSKETESPSYEQHARLFESRAFGTLEVCYAKDREHTQELVEVMNKENQWNVNLLELAKLKNNRRIFSTGAYKEYFHNLWRDQIHAQTTPLKIVICTFVFPLILWEKAIKFKTQKGKKNENEGLRDDKKKEKDTNHMNCCQKLSAFYHSVVVKYTMNVACYILFLGIFGHLILVDLQPEFTPLEGVVAIWVFAICVEEIFQFATTSVKVSYFSEGWNILDLFCIGFYIVALVLRSLPFDGTYEAGRVFFSFDYMFFFWRLVHICTVNSSLGPILIMIWRMVTRDLIPFLLIMFIFIESYAIATEAILYPNAVWSWKFLLHLSRKAFFQIFGEFLLDEIEGDVKNPPCTTNKYLAASDDDYIRCPTEVGKYVVPIMMAFYVLATIVLLLNIVIAVFNNTFKDIRNRNQQYWAWQSCQLTIEYKEKPVAPVPLSLIWRFFQMVARLQCLKAWNERRKMKRLTKRLSRNSTPCTKGNLGVRFYKTAAEVYGIDTEDEESDNTSFGGGKIVIDLDDEEKQISSDEEKVQLESEENDKELKNKGSDEDKLNLESEKDNKESNINTQDESYDIQEFHANKTKVNNDENNYDDEKEDDKANNEKSEDDGESDSSSEESLNWQNECDKRDRKRDSYWDDDEEEEDFWNREEWERSMGEVYLATTQTEKNVYNF